jgi:hypothetical protein
MKISQTLFSCLKLMPTQTDLSPPCWHSWMHWDLKRTLTDLSGIDVAHTARFDWNMAGENCDSWLTLTAWPFINVTRHNDVIKNIILEWVTDTLDESTLCVAANEIQRQSHKCTSIAAYVVMKIFIDYSARDCSIDIKSGARSYT